MFAYCLNNPIAFSDSGGTAAKISLSAQTSIDDAPWRDASPGGGGYPAANYSHSVSYGSVEDKFFTVMLYKFITNTDAEVAAEAEHFVYYNGVPIVKLDFMDDMAFSFGTIYMGPISSADLVKHEYGHAVHMMQIGPVNYAFKVALPSAVSFWLFPKNPYYESQPWEYIAEFFGQPSPPTEGYLTYADELAFVYWIFTFI